MAARLCVGSGARARIRRVMDARRGCVCAAVTTESVSRQLDAQFKAFIDGHTPQPQIILGTQSSSRRAIVDQLAVRYGFKYSVIAADIDERAIRRPTPRELVLAIAHAKAEAIVDKLTKSGSLVRPGYLVTCDQVVVHKGLIREKPLTEEEARTFIQTYADAPAETVGSCVCVCLETGKSYESVDVNRVYFDEIPDDVIDKLIAEGGVFECAGGLMVEHPLVRKYVLKVDGSLEGTMGLSKTAFMEVLLKTGDATSGALCESAP